MAAPNGMAPLSEAQVNALLERMGPAAVSTYQSMSLPEKQQYLSNAIKQWSIRQRAQQQQQQQQGGGQGIQHQQQFNQQQQQQQGQQVRPAIDFNALAQAQALAKAQNLNQQQQQLQGGQRPHGQPGRPDTMPINLNYTPEQVQNMQTSNPQIAQLLRQVQATGQLGQLGQLPPGALQQANQLLQAQQMQAQNHIQMQQQQQQQSPHMGQMPMPRTPSQVQLNMQRNGSAQGGSMQHPSSPATFSSPQGNQQSPLQGTPQQHSMALGATGQMGAQIQQRPGPPPGLNAQQLKAYEMMQQGQAMRPQASQPGQQRPPMRPPMQQQQQQQLQQQAFAAARNGQMLQNGQMQGMQVRQNRPPLTQGFNSGPPGPAVDRIVDHLQTLSQMRDQDELDQAQKEALNKVISNPAVLQSAFLGRAAKAQEERLSAVSAELGRVQNVQINQLEAQQVAQLQAMMNNPLITPEQRQAMINRFAQQGFQLPPPPPQQQQQLSAEELAKRTQAAGMATGAAGPNPSSNGSVPSPVSANHNRQGSTGSRPGGVPTGMGENSQHQQLFAHMHNMTEERRDGIYQKNPQLRNWYKRQMELYLQRAHESRIEPELAQAQAQIGSNPAVQGQLQGQQMPLPNLALPLNRARAVSQQGNGLPLNGPNMAVAQAAAMAQNAQQNAQQNVMAQQQLQLQAVVAQAQTAIQQQQNTAVQSQSQSPNPQGTPLHRANGSFSGPRGATPAAQAAMAAANANLAQRQSPQVRQGGLAGTPPANATQMDLQMRMQGNMPNNGGMQQANQPQGGMQNRPATPNIPHGFQKIQLNSMIIPDKLLVDGSASRPFPNAEGPRPTLSVGLGPGPITGLPALEERPPAFEDLLTWLRTKIDPPKRTTKIGLFGKPKSAEEDSTGSVAEEAAAPAKPAGRPPPSSPVVVRASRKRTVSEIARNVDKGLLLNEGSVDFMLELADEYLESAAEAACRLAKLRKGNRLEVKDLQLHLERDTNIFIPGFAYEAIRVDQAPFLRKNPPVSSRAARLAAVQQAKRDGGPINIAPAKHAQAFAV